MYVAVFHVELEKVSKQNLLDTWKKFKYSVTIQLCRNLTAAVRKSSRPSACLWLVDAVKRFRALRCEIFAGHFRGQNVFAVTVSIQVGLKREGAIGETTWPTCHQNARTPQECRAFKYALRCNYIDASILCQQSNFRTILKSRHWLALQYALTTSIQPLFNWSWSLIEFLVFIWFW